jgi:hypothetical protein
MMRLPTHRWTLSCMIFLVCVGMVSAQPLPGLSVGGVDAALTRLFGEHKAFSALAVLKVYDPDESELFSATMGFAVRDEKLRMDVDLSKLKSPQLPAGIVGSLAQLGMENVVSLVLPKKRASYLIYPGLEATLKVPMDGKDLSVTAADFQLDRVAVGKETLEGHACIKYRVTVTDASGTTQEATTWNAVGLRDFPLQIRMSDGGNLMILRFRNVKLVEPKAELFDLPSAYTQYDSQEALMRAVMLKALGGLGGS